MKLINKKDDQIVFSANMSESLANAIRRSINQIPVAAIDEVEISRNDSPLYDETIAHRLGLISLRTDKALDPKKPTKIKLDSKNEGFIYSGEIKGPVKVVYGKVPITVLKKGQELELTATLKTGKGEEHAKFLPGIMFYRNAVKIKVGADCPTEVIDACHHKVLNLKDGKINVTDEYLCDLCDACVEVCTSSGKKEVIKLEPSDELVITLESFGQLDTNDIFKKSVDSLKKDLAEVSKKISK